MIVDATFLSSEAREALADVASSADVGFAGLWLEAPAAALADRLRARTGDASDATADVLAEQIAHDPGAVSWQRLDASRGANAVVAAARMALNLR